MSNFDSGSLFIMAAIHELLYDILVLFICCVGDNMDLSPDDILRRRATITLAHLRESQRQLVRDIQEQYNELGTAVDHLRSYFAPDSDDDVGEFRPRSANASESLLLDVLSYIG